jgi:hypothetical protein
MAQGSITIAQNALAAGLIASANFAAICPDPTHPATQIYYEDLPAPADGETYQAAELAALRPYAMIFLPRGGWFATKQAQDTSEEFFDRGILCLRLSRVLPANLSLSAATTDWNDTWYAIVSDLMGVAGQPGYLAFREVSILDGPGRHFPKYDPAQGPEQGIDLAFSWPDIER